jgi:hypothetical protein
MQHHTTRELHRIIGQKTEDVCIILENQAKTILHLSFIKPQTTIKHNNLKGKDKVK